MRLNVRRIERELEKRRWNKGILAKEIGITRAGVHHAMRKQRCTFATLTKIAKVLEVNPKDLLLIH